MTTIQVTFDARKKIAQALRDAGYTYKAIGEFLGVSTPRAYRICS